MMDCEALLLKSDLPDKVKRHCLAVAETAEALAKALVEKGLPLDAALCRRAALLHDICRTEPRHAEQGAAYLASLGMEKEAEIVRVHMGDGMDFSRLDEAAVVYLADKLTLQARRVSIQERFQMALKKFGEEPEVREKIAVLRENSLRLAAQAEKLLGFPLETVS